MTLQLLQRARKNVTEERLGAAGHSQKTIEDVSREGLCDNAVAAQGLIRSTEPPMLFILFGWVGGFEAQKGVACGNRSHDDLWWPVLVPAGLKVRGAVTSGP